MKVFEYVFATTRGGPGTETETLQYFIYQTGIQFFRLGSASSMAFVVLLLVLTIIVIAFRRMEKAQAVVRNAPIALAVCRVALLWAAGITVLFPVVWIALASVKTR